MELNDAEVLLAREMLRDWPRFKDMFPKNARTDLAEGHPHASTASNTDFEGLEDNAGQVVLPDTDDRIRVTDDGKVNADKAGNTLALSIAESQMTHDDLSGGTTSGAHHDKYTDSEARAAVPYAAPITFGWAPQDPQVFAP